MITTTNAHRVLERIRTEVASELAVEGSLLATPLEDRGDDTTTSQHPADVASSLADREMANGRVRHLLLRLRELDSALARLRDSTYGQCQDCVGPIPEARLEARPEATRCIDCQQIVERRPRPR